jgi:hypothetical protein
MFFYAWECTGVEGILICGLMFCDAWECTDVEGILLSIPFRALGLGFRNFSFRVEKGFQLYL